MVSKFENILHEIVSVWVFNKILHLVNNEVGKLQLLIPGALLEASLHDTASVLVHSDLDAALHASLKDKLSVLGCDFTSQPISIRRAL